MRGVENINSISGCVCVGVSRGQSPPENSLNLTLIKENIVQAYRRALAEEGHVTYIHYRKSGKSKRTEFASTSPRGAGWIPLVEEGVEAGEDEQRHHGAQRHHVVEL